MGDGVGMEVTASVGADVELADDIMEAVVLTALVMVTAMEDDMMTIRTGWRRRAIREGATCDGTSDHDSGSSKRTLEAVRRGVKGKMNRLYRRRGSR